MHLLSTKNSYLHSFEFSNCLRSQKRYIVNKEIKSYGSSGVFVSDGLSHFRFFQIKKNVELETFVNTNGSLLINNKSGVLGQSSPSFSDILNKNISFKGLTKRRYTSKKKKRNKRRRFGFFAEQYGGKKRFNRFSLVRLRRYFFRRHKIKRLHYFSRLQGFMPRLCEAAPYGTLRGLKKYYRRLRGAGAVWPIFFSYLFRRKRLSRKHIRFAARVLPKASISRKYIWFQKGSLKLKETKWTPFLLNKKTKVLTRSLDSFFNFLGACLSLEYNVFGLAFSNPNFVESKSRSYFTYKKRRTRTKFKQPPVKKVFTGPFV